MLRTACAATSADLCSETFAGALEGVPPLRSGEGHRAGLADRHRPPRAPAVPAPRGGLHPGPSQARHPLPRGGPPRPRPDRRPRRPPRRSPPTSAPPSTRCPRACASAVLLRIVEELPYDEIAERLGCTAGNARVRVCRGLDRLEAYLGGIVTTTTSFPDCARSSSPPPGGARGPPAPPPRARRCRGRRRRCRRSPLRQSSPPGRRIPSPPASRSRSSTAASWCELTDVETRPAVVEAALRDVGLDATVDRGRRARRPWAGSSAPGTDLPPTVDPQGDDAGLVRRLLRTRRPPRPPRARRSADRPSDGEDYYAPDRRLRCPVSRCRAPGCTSAPVAELAAFSRRAIPSSRSRVQAVPRDRCHAARRSPRSPTTRRSPTCASSMPTATSAHR